MTSIADTIRHYLVQYLPDGFRDEDGVWHEGPHRAQSLAALDALLAENQRLSDEMQRLREMLGGVPAELLSWEAREALAGDTE